MLSRPRTRVSLPRASAFPAAAAAATARRASSSSSSSSSAPAEHVVPRTYGTPSTAGTAEAAAVAAAAERVVLPEVCEHLIRHGYAVVDGALDGVTVGEGGASLSETLRRELDRLASSSDADADADASSAGSSRAPDGMKRNATVLVQKDRVVELEKANIFEAEVHAMKDEMASRFPALRALREDRTFLTLLNAHAPPRTRAEDLHHQVVKLQVNFGMGACFPLHFDSAAELDGRRVTALTYLNPGWKEGDGGELVVYPFPSPPVKIEPRMGRVVLFSAANMLHRVLPSKARRLCFTQWFFARSAGGSSVSSSAAGSSGSAANGGVGGDGGDVAAAQVAALLRPEMRKHLMKVVHADEWAKSIEASHPDTPERKMALDTHWREVDVISRALAGKFPAGLAEVAAMSGPGEDAERARAATRVEWF